MFGSSFTNWRPISFNEILMKLTNMAKSGLKEESFMGSSKLTHDINAHTKTPSLSSAHPESIAIERKSLRS